MPKTPFLLLILDGFGYRESPEFNAIAKAHMPVWNHLWQHHPHLLVSASGLDVGLPDQQMGNSEVGHMNIGAGRIVYQDLTRIDLSIQEGDFFNNLALTSACQKAKKQGTALHVMGLVSPGGVHSHESHLYAMLRLAKREGVEQVLIHAFLDGRDTPPQSAIASIQALEQECARLGLGQIVTLMGRYYAMDRDRRWDRVQAAYECIVGLKAHRICASAEAAVLAAYEQGETDEFVKPTWVGVSDDSVPCLQSGDVVVFMNFRADRARQLMHALVDETYHHFPRQALHQLSCTTLTQYEAGLPVQVAYLPQSLTNTLGAWLSALGKTQLRAAETEKYAHVTFFFNGGIEAPYEGEDRILVPSPRVSTYDLQPEMSALPLTDCLVDAILSQRYDLIVCNYANPDMLGHTGIFEAAVTALETVDECLGRVLAALKKVEGQMIITADHGNVECMVDPDTAQPHTAHTNLPVPCVYVGASREAVKTQGILADIAPTILALMNFPIPEEMTGEILFHA